MTRNQNKSNATLAAKKCAFQEINYLAILTFLLCMQDSTRSDFNACTKT